MPPIAHVADQVDLDVSALAYPNQREAADMLAIASSTLTRRKTPAVRVGHRDKRFRPGVLIAEAAVQRRRPLREVADALIAYARRNAPDAAATIEAEVHAALSAHHLEARHLTPAILADARRVLPDPLFERVRSIFDELDHVPYTPNLALTDEDIKDWEEAVDAGLLDETSARA